MTSGDIRKIAWNLIAEQGAVTVDDLRAACLEHGADTKKVDGQVEGSLRMLVIDGLITESAGPNGGKYFILSKKGKQKVEAERRKLERPERGDPYEFTAKIRLTCISLAGAIPTGDDAERGALVFHRDLQKRVMLLPKTWQGLFRRVFEENGLPKYVADWLNFDPVILETETLLVKEPVPPARPGMPGQGVNTIEALPIGTEITVTGIFPGKAVPKKALRAIWGYAGRVGYSNAKSKLGYGKFEVLDCRVTADLPALFNMDESADLAVAAVM